jgi:hypothetical protein
MSPTEHGPARPRQVTVAGWLVVLGSVFVVLTVFERISGLHSLETRESIQRFLSEPPGDGLGLEVNGVLTLIRTLAMVAAGCATAAAILGYHVLRRSRSARLALTVVAVPLFLTGLVTGGFMSSVVLAATVMLWFQPARDWFDGVTRPAPDRVERTTERVHPSGAVGPGTGPRPFPGFGAGASSRAPAGAPGPTPVPQPVPAARPNAVVWACALTWACTGLATVGLLLSVVMVLAAPDLVFDELRRQDPSYADRGLSDAAITTATYVTAAVGILWSVAAAVLAVLVFRRVGWARTALIGSAAAAAMICLLASVGNLLLVLPFGAALAVVLLLLRPDARAWFAVGRPPRPRG